MFANIVRVKNPADCIFKLTKEFTGVTVKNHTEFIKKDIRMRAYQKAQADHVILASGSRWGGRRVQMALVQCEEHSCAELVPAGNYWNDLVHWYHVGRHPRFSITGALIKDDQRWSEIPYSRRMRGERRTQLDQAIAQCTSEADFLKRMHPHLFTNLYIRGRRMRVTNAFKEKFLKKDFTTTDFFREVNQEIRRAMLRVLPIKKIIQHMRLVSKDKEGKLYSHDRRRYLYVVCPSTKQEYLLEVPASDGGQSIRTPSHARRWTFNVPEDARFVKEA